MLALSILLGVAVILIPGNAFAWGPITHIVHGSTVLANITSLPAGLQAILGAHPYCYLYGCIGADIIQAKAYTRSVATHCHSWPVAWKLQEEADTDAQRAFAWGYMTHLAADIISHNHFVPTYLLLSFDRRTLGHAYWEARADSLQGRGYWERARSVLARTYEDCDRLVENVVEHTLFSFKTNKRIFDSLMGLSKLEQWRRFMERATTRSSFEMTRATVEHYNGACSHAALDLLTQGRQSYTQSQDATGKEILERAIKLRRRLRTLKRQGRFPAGTERALVEEIIPELAELRVTAGAQASPA